jgi:disulfide bond formation protein DsbB
MIKIKNKKILYLVLLFSFFALIAAYFIQYILGHQPCNLCLIERRPYMMAIMFILLLFFLKKYEKFFLISLSLTFFLATLISFYHFGIEQGFFEESLVCDLKSGQKTLTTEELLKELNKKTISCKDVSFKILGFSLATLNTIISFVLSVILFKIYLSYEKK